MRIDMGIMDIEDKETGNVFMSSSLSGWGRFVNVVLKKNTRSCCSSLDHLFFVFAGVFLFRLE